MVQLAAHPGARMADLISGIKGYKEGEYYLWHN